MINSNLGMFTGPELHAYMSVGPVSIVIGENSRNTSHDIQIAVGCEYLSSSLDFIKIPKLFNQKQSI